MRVTAVDVYVIGAWFIAWRLWAAVVAGVSGDLAMLDEWWQLLPLDGLEANFAQSLWFLHSQPPLFNALVGVVLHLPGDVVWIRLLWLATGVAFPLVAFWSLRTMGVQRLSAHVLVLLFGLNPTLLLYENLYFYSYVEAFCVLVTMAALLGRRLHAPAFAIGATTLVGMRAFFQPLWAAAVAVALLVSHRAHRSRSTALWLLLPLVFGLAIVLKNGLLFGVWNTSSWYGLNLSRGPVAALAHDRVDLVARGIVSPAFAIGPFESVSRYPPELTRDIIRAARERYGAPAALLSETKLDGRPNFNHVGQIALSRLLLRDSIAAAMERPGPVAATVARGIGLFFEPASDTAFVTANRDRLQPLVWLADSLFYPGRSPVLVIAWLVFGAASAAWIWLCAPAGSDDLRAAAAFVCLTTLWVAALGTLAEYGENNRFRFSLDAMLFVWNTGVLWRLMAAGRPDILLD